ncbi:MAG: hypothetical protein ACYSSL_06260 [Planctomycetota bacterium]|jgi:hypothetical protein
MADDNYNIKPVENLQNIGGLNSVGRRKERKRKQNLREQDQEKRQQEQGNPTKQDLDDETLENQDNQRSIDYCA